MTKEQLFGEVIGRIRHRFPEALPGITSLPVHDWNDEIGLTTMLEDILGRCGSDTLDASYALHVNGLYEKEHGPDAGVGMVNASLELRCRALVQALTDIG